MGSAVLFQSQPHVDRDPYLLRILQTLPATHAWTRNHLFIVLAVPQPLTPRSKSAFMTARMCYATVFTNTRNSAEVSGVIRNGCGVVGVGLEDFETRSPIAATRQETSPKLLQT